MWAYFFLWTKPYEKIIPCFFYLLAHNLLKYQIVYLTDFESQGVQQQIKQLYLIY